MTLYFTNNTLNSCSLNLNDNISTDIISGSTYLLSFKSDTSLKTYTVYSTDLSLYPERYSKFEFYVSASSSANILTVTESGNYTYNVYLSGSNTSLDEGRAIFNMGTQTDISSQYSQSGNYTLYKG